VPASSASAYLLHGASGSSRACSSMWAVSTRLARSGSRCLGVSLPRAAAGHVAAL
jgi:hypothetical protein